VDAVTDKLRERGKDEAKARAVVEAALGGMGLAVQDDGQTQYLLFLSQSGIDALADVCEKQWDELAEIVEKTGAAKAEQEEAIPEQIKQALDAVLAGGKAADLALFGRMLADRPERNIDAACQVAHAISTNKVAMEMDFYTAVDDLKSTEEDAGAGMMGVIGYNSACFYRYAVLDWDQLVGNLDGDTDLAERTLEAFLRASALAVPTGKQNTFAAHSRPDFILSVVRTDGPPLSLANAFVEPARPCPDRDLTASSVDGLAEYWKAVTRVYGGDGIAGLPCCGTTLPAEDGHGWQCHESFDELIQAVLGAVRAGGKP